MLAFVVAVGLLLGGAGWYFAGVLLRTARESDYPDRVIGAPAGEVLLAPSHWAGQPGEWVLRWPGGWVGVGPVLEQTPTEVRRPLLAGASAPAPGTAVNVDVCGYLHPAEIGLPATETVVATPLGGCPAWLVPGESSTWVVAVHGRGVDRSECLRILPTLHRLGLPVLAVSYRNDPGAPASPDGHYHLGDTEWQDVAAAVTHAVALGASSVVLYGWSMGGAITGAYLDRAPEANTLVRGVVWDSPLLDWRATLRFQARLRRLPPGVAELTAKAAEMITSRRIGIDFDRFDLVRHPPEARPPTLVFHGDADTTVPIAPARALAAEAPALAWPLRYVEVPAAEHTASWNVAPARYESEVAKFLEAATQGP